MWRGAAPRRRRLPKGCPTRGAAGKLLDEALLQGDYFPDAHLDVILPTLLAFEAFVLVDHDQRRRRHYRFQFTFAGELLDKALLRAHSFAGAHGDVVLLAHLAWSARRSCSSTRSASTTSSSTRSTGRGRDLDAKAPDLCYCVAGPFGAHFDYLFSAYSLCLLTSAKSTTTRPAHGDGPRGDPEFAMMDLGRGRSSTRRRSWPRTRTSSTSTSAREPRRPRLRSRLRWGLGLSVRGFGLRVGLSAGLRLRCSGLRAPGRRPGACAAGKGRWAR